MKKLLSLLLCLSLVLSLGMLSVLASEELSFDADAPEETVDSEISAEAEPEEALPALDGEEPGDVASEGGDTGSAGKVTPTDAEGKVTPTDAEGKKKDPIDSLIGDAPLDPEITSGVIEGSNLRWNVDKETGILTVSGAGDMPDFADVLESPDSSLPVAPWRDCRAVITKIVVEEGITSLGSYAFARLPLVTEVSLPASLTDIGKGAFYYGMSLT